ncbi:hypothetical protein A5752_19605 [Mycobacterium sp. 852002-51961_SCH5331710]|nr:hypothetical protein A5752_19605 [Mycobacterium sp. 852002-51961_SCH5331710]
MQMLGTGVATGQPADDASAPVVTTFGWQQLGINQQLSFVGHDMTQKLSIPVPQGLVPTALSGVIGAVNNVPSGVIEAQTQDGRFVGSVPIPLVPPGQPPVPFSFDIGAVPVIHGEIQLNLVLRVNDDEVCDPLPTLVMSDLSAAFAGAQQPPTTIEEFLPVIAPVVDLYVDPAPTDAEKSATLNLVAAVSRYYQPATVPVNVRPLPRTEAGPPPERDPSVRSIVIRDVDEPKPSVRLITDAGAPYLLISGQGENLVQQAGLFRDGLQKLAQTDVATIESTDIATDGQAPRTSTFEQLRIGGNTAVLGESYIFMNISPALSRANRLGAVDVRLLANYTPVDEKEKGTMVVTAGDLVLVTARLDSSGRVDSRFSIPADVAARDQDLTVTVRYEPGPGCNPFTLPMNFEIDPKSTATVRPGGTVAMGGFAALPQGFVPRFQVALDDSDPDQLAHAARIIGLIQRLTSTALRPEVVSIEDAASSDTSALIIGSAQTVEENDLDPPIAPRGGMSVVDMPSSAVIDIPTGLAALQTYAQNNRTIVLLTASGPWTLANPLFDYLAGLPRGWRDLSGDVLVVGQQLVPRELTVRADGPVMEGAGAVDSDSATQQSNTRDWYEWAVLGAGVLVILALIAGALVALLRRRPRADATAGSSPEPPESSAPPAQPR